MGTAITYTQYLRDGAQVVYEKTWTISGTTLTPQGDKTYITAGGKMAVTRQTVSGTTTYTYYATDHLGTVRSTVTVNASGTEQYRTFHDYEPFGLEIPVRDTVSPNTHKFAGHERDAETGNDYMHFRMFEASFGRFMKPDSIVDNMASPQSWNLYSYVHGNPVRYTDPMGHLSPAFRSCIQGGWASYTGEPGGDLGYSMGGIDPFSWDPWTAYLYGSPAAQHSASTAAVLSRGGVWVFQPGQTVAIASSDFSLTVAHTGEWKWIQLVDSTDAPHSWSASFGLFEGVGFEIEFGRNLDGRPFLTVRTGAGVGGGWSISKEGASVNYRNNHGSPAFNFGFYSKAGAAFGPLDFGGTSTHMGWTYERWGDWGWTPDDYLYGPERDSPGVDMDIEQRFTASGSGGVELSMSL